MARALQKIETPRKVDLTRLTGSGRAPGPIVRDLSKSRDDAGHGAPMWRAFRSERSWLVTTLVNVLILLVVALGILVGPPMLECRQRAEIGFFAGNSLSRCVGEATNRRLRLLEDKINSFVRGSGA